MNSRIGWSELPASVRSGIEEILGGPVVEAATQSGGFSPGSADRVRLASGRRAFVKAVSADVNATSATLHRREAAITASLPPALPMPRLLGTYDDGTWVALALTDVDGRHPREPWQEDELGVVLHTLAEVARVELPAGLDLPLYQDSLRGAFMGWEKLQRRPMEGLDPWALVNLAELVALARAGVECLAGTSLVHGDLRTDNILLTGGPGGDTGGSRAVLVDWPWAAVGAFWVDALSVLINVKSLDPDSRPERFLDSHPAFSGVPAAAINGVLAGFAGYFMDMSRRPDSPGMPTLRAFQRKQADALVGWLKLRLDTP
ncbi:aminoglycoside phosphotransferase (APT) family kinase protein [Arthrobacter silviterrae]|uniref:Phosphotransferase n=1 Tax=Arthrobacter silviterrae TaxID=2026658 RepID=A0ABX0D5A8_9MICC|nr:phosphotransferase [Arthrobacter silviterrae]MDQ0279448.1 aminoglycoside phosphotransferase (APT) family kinase protein [Arthrobacter silviterrae]NGN82072.1 phosphotransferase [Arthrobacter silviterrae]